MRYAVNMLGDHAKVIESQEDLDKFTVSDPEYMFVGKCSFSLIHKYNF